MDSFLNSWAIRATLSLGFVLCGCERAVPPRPFPSATRPGPSTASGRDQSVAVRHALVDESKSDTGKEPHGPARSGDWFEDVTAGSGIDFVHHNGREAGRYYLIESFGGGVAMVDYDLDGDIDLFFTGGGTISAEPQVPQIGGLPSALYRNQCGWQFDDVSRTAGFSQPADYSLGCTVTDYDCDGFPDLFVCCYGRSRLYRNLGDGTFEEAASATQLPATGMGTVAAWADLDRDGFPDLFLGRYVEWSPDVDVHCKSGPGIRDLCGPTQYHGTIAFLFHNRGDGDFDDWSLTAGLKGDVKALGLLAGDFNGDGWIDFYLANDEVANHLYWGGPDGRLTEDAWQAGVAANELGLEEGSMGVDAGDVDGDGLPDLWVVNFENEDNSLYRNQDHGLFRHATVQFGLAGVSRMRVGWGTALADFDSDGWLDIVVLNSNALYFSRLTPFLQAPQLFRNLDGQRFQDVSEYGGTYFQHVHAGRGAAVGDLDDDGALDLVASHLNESAALLKNLRPPTNFISVLPRATLGAREPIGARVMLESGFQRELTRFVVVGRGYASHSDSRILFPVLPDSSTADITVQWPGRGIETFRNLAVRHTHTLIEGRGEPRGPR